LGPPKWDACFSAISNRVPNTNLRRRIKLKKLIVFATLLFFIIGPIFLTSTAQAGKKLKAGFIYVGPVGDYGWSHAHEMGRRYAMKNLP